MPGGRSVEGGKGVKSAFQNPLLLSRLAASSLRIGCRIAETDDWHRSAEDSTAGFERHSKGVKHLRNWKGWHLPLNRGGERLRRAGRFRLRVMAVMRGTL